MKAGKEKKLVEGKHNASAAVGTGGKQVKIAGIMGAAGAAPASPGKPADAEDPLEHLNKLNLRKSQMQGLSPVPFVKGLDGKSRQTQVASVGGGVETINFERKTSRELEREEHEMRLEELHSLEADLLELRANSLADEGLAITEQTHLYTFQRNYRLR